MRIMLWTTSFLLLALWSLVVWGAAGLVGMASLGLPAELDALAGTFAADSWLAKLSLIGQGALIFVWAAGATALLLGTAVLGRTARAAGRLLRGGTARAYGRPRFASGHGARGLGGKLASRLAPRLLRAMRR